MQPKSRRLQRHRVVVKSSRPSHDGTLRHRAGKSVGLRTRLPQCRRYGKRDHSSQGVHASARHAEVKADLEAQGITVVDLELTHTASVDKAAAQILAAGPVDVLVNNAGAAYFGVVEAFTADRIQQQFDVNVFGPMRVTRAFLLSMRERRSGLIVT